MSEALVQSKRKEIARIIDASTVFASATEPFGREAVTQDSLDELRSAFSAQAHPDFHMPVFDVPDQQSDIQVYGQAGEGIKDIAGRWFSLPFRLSLGLHKSVPEEINDEATKALFESYQHAVTVLGLLEGREEARMLRRTQSAVAAAVIEAAATRAYICHARSVARYARKEGLITRRQRLMLSSLVEVVSTP